MANRKNMQTDPIFDNSAIGSDSEIETSKVVHALESVQLNSIIRRIKKAPLASIEVIRTAVESRLKELEVLSSPDQAVKEIPTTGSDQFDAGSFVNWVSKVRADDPASVMQLIVIDATVKDRLAQES